MTLQLGHNLIFKKVQFVVPLFDPKVDLFENSLLKIMAQLHQM